MKTPCMYFLVSSLVLHSTKATLLNEDSLHQPHNSDNENANECTKPALTGNMEKTHEKNLTGACAFPVLKPMDCEELLHLGYNKSGAYDIWPKNKIMDDKPIHVFCDMDTDKGGWTVLQRRGNFHRPIDFFYKNWTDYKSGFGNIEDEFWLGNDNIFALTNQKQYSVRFDLTDMTGDHRYARYDIFYIENEENNYRLTIKEYSGTANDSMIFHNGMEFSTEDRNNDNDLGNCASAYKSGWWLTDCYHVNLNGLNFRGKHESSQGGINWFHFTGYNESLDKAEIKIRPKNFFKSLML